MNLPYLTPLAPEAQIAFGLAAPQPLAQADRVRFSELDLNHHVNNKAYMSWFETLRVRYFDMLCLEHYNGQPHPRIVLRNANVRFIREMLADEDYVVTARVSAFRTTSFTMEQQIWAGDLRATMEGVVVTLTPDGTARLPLPDSLRAEFVTRDGAAAET